MQEEYASIWFISYIYMCTVSWQKWSIGPFGPEYCSETVWSCLPVSADRRLSEVKHTHLPQSHTVIDTGHIRAKWILNWTERNRIDSDWRGRSCHGGITQSRRTMTRKRIRSVMVLYPLNSYPGSQWDDESIPACNGFLTHRYSHVCSLKPRLNRWFCKTPGQSWLMSSCSCTQFGWFRYHTKARILQFWQILTYSHYKTKGHTSLMSNKY